MPGGHRLQAALDLGVRLHLQPRQALGEVQGNRYLVFRGDDLLAQALQLGGALLLKTFGRGQFADDQRHDQQIRLVLLGKPRLADGRQGHQGRQFGLHPILDAEGVNGCLSQSGFAHGNLRQRLPPC